VDGRWTPTFPNARYIFSKAELDHWSVPGGQDELSAQVYQDSVLPVVAAGLAEALVTEALAFFAWREEANVIALRSASCDPIDERE
jgi:hypothetical protein